MGTVFASRSRTRTASLVTLLFLVGHHIGPPVFSAEHPVGLFIAAGVHKGRIKRQLSPGAVADIYEMAQRCRSCSNFNFSIKGLNNSGFLSP
jgi:hypothetical protein